MFFKKDSHKKLSLKYFLYEIVHHCNLNCKGCDHCAPLASEEYVDIDVYEKDISQMKKLFPRIQSIGIMGGEPLLHNQLSEILNITRKLLPDADILLFSNGLLFDKADDDLWRNISNNKIVLKITKYNNNAVYQLIKDKAIEYSIDLFFMDETEYKSKKFNAVKYNLEGNEDINENHKKCYHARICSQLENGRLYKCSIACASKHFNEYFSKNLQITENDYIDIYSNPTEQKIIDYFKNPIPFCKYCNLNIRKEKFDWALSKREISEWT